MSPAPTKCACAKANPVEPVVPTPRSKAPFIALGVLAVAGVGAVVYAAMKKPASATPVVPEPGAVPGGSSVEPAPGGTGETSGAPQVGTHSGAPTSSQPIHTHGWFSAIDATGHFTFQPGVVYRMSIVPQAGMTFAQYKTQFAAESGGTFALGLQGWDAGAALPSDWPLSDRDPSRWRFQFTYDGAGPETKLAGSTLVFVH
jgi:hypothetical protein